MNENTESNNSTSTTEKDEHTCGEPCQIYSRVTGYYRPVSNWNIGKQEEFKERKRFIVNRNCCGDK